jgi:hypothetical protein
MCIRDRAAAADPQLEVLQAILKELREAKGPQD